MSVQSAAIPYRIDERGEIWVLLVTSRTRRRWIIPRGAIGSRMLASRSAEREAFEEAGVIGQIDKEPIGSYRQMSDRRLGTGLITVLAFPLKVIDEIDEWHESHQRERRWFTLEDARRTVRGKEIKAILRVFERQIKRGPSQS